MVVHPSSLTTCVLMPSIYHTVMGYVRRSKQQPWNKQDISLPA
jgi:hypothetical protein